jgi:hypothetical protein
MSILKSHSGLIFKKLFSKECLDGRGENIHSILLKFHSTLWNLREREQERR